MPKRSKENDSRRMLKHLSAILEKSGVIIFEYHVKTDTLIRYNKELEVDAEIPESAIISGTKHGYIQMTDGKLLNFTADVSKALLISGK